MRKQRGWTLIEILVVIAIIAVLAGLIYAVGAYALERSRQATCVSNLRQIGMALKMYMEDYKRADWDAEIDRVNQYSSRSEVDNLLSHWGFPIRLDDLLRAGYIRDERILRCGSARPPLSEGPIHYLYQLPSIFSFPNGSTHNLFEVFKLRTYEYPIVVDMSHRNSEFYSFIVLRMNQSVQIKRIPNEKWENSWDL